MTSWYCIQFDCVVFIVSFFYSSLCCYLLFLSFFLTWKIIWWELVSSYFIYNSQPFLNLILSMDIGMSELKNLFFSEGFFHNHIPKLVYFGGVSVAFPKISVWVFFLKFLFSSEISHFIWPTRHQKFPDLFPETEDPELQIFLFLGENPCLKAKWGQCLQGQGRRAVYPSQWGWIYTL